LETAPPLVPSGLTAANFPPRRANPNELPDRLIVL